MYTTQTLLQMFLHLTPLFTQALGGVMSTLPLLDCSNSTVYCIELWDK